MKNDSVQEKILSVLNLEAGMSLDEDSEMAETLAHKVFVEKKADRLIKEF